MQIQLWTADVVPSFVPEFVSSHVTVDQDFLTGKEYYILYLNHKHKLFENCKSEFNQMKLARKHMLQLGFVNPRYVDKDKILPEEWNCPCCVDNN